MYAHVLEKYERGVMNTLYFMTKEKLNEGVVEFLRLFATRL